MPLPTSMPKVPRRLGLNPALIPCETTRSTAGPGVSDITNSVRAKKSKSFKDMPYFSFSPSFNRVRQVPFEVRTASTVFELAGEKVNHSNGSRKSNKRFLTRLKRHQHT